MLSRRRHLIQKLEGLSDEVIAHFERQADLLLTLPEYTRCHPAPHLQLLTPDTNHLLQMPRAEPAKVAGITPTTRVVLLGGR
jgi:hypothetical protein